MPKIRLFEKSKLKNGYSIAVRDDFGSKIIRRHIQEEHKQLYIKEFDNKIISDSNFFEWWGKVNNKNTKSVSYLLTPDQVKHLHSRKNNNS